MSDAHRFATILRRAPAADRVILVVTFGLTVFADLVVAVNVGVILAVLHFLRRMSESVETHAVESHTLAAELADMGEPALPAGVLVYEIAGPMFFGAVENFQRALLESNTLPRALVLRLNRVPFMDITGIQTLEEVIATLRRRQVTVLLCEANARVLGKLRRAGVVPAEAGERHARYHDTLGAALREAAAATAGTDEPSAGAAHRSP